MNARFWIYINGGPVKLTLKRGQVLQHYKEWACCNRLASEHHRWECTLYCVMGAVSSELEGCERSFYEDYCPIEDLHMGASVDGVTYPRWKPLYREENPLP